MKIIKKIKSTESIYVKKSWSMEKRGGLGASLKIGGDFKIALSKIFKVTTLPTAIQHPNHYSFIFS